MRNESSQCNRLAAQHWLEHLFHLVDADRSDLFVGDAAVATNKERLGHAVQAVIDRDACLRIE